MQEKAHGRFITGTLLAVVLLLGVVGLRFVFGRPAFDAERVARAETRMWQAYYSGNKTQLGLQLVALLRNQFGLSLPEAKAIGELLASSAMKFRASRGDYDRVVIPDLAKAYGLIQLATHASFDPNAAARAELAWWVARRTPGQNSAAQVGEKIAGLYATLYGGARPEFEKAGLLRAQAAALRDAGGQDADWERVEALLRDSYHELGTL